VSPEDVQRLRHAQEESGTVLRDLSNLHERIKLLQEEAAARVAEENNRSLFVLTLVTVMALPINLISGLLGMNVGGVPLNQHGHGFWWVLGFVLALTGGLGWWLWRRLAPR
jgi:zinc transporter